MLKHQNRFSRHAVFSFALIVAMVVTLLAVPVGQAAKPIEYPKARKGDVVDDYFGTKVPDPYRWLEDPDSPETRAWVEAENRITFRFLEQIPERDQIKRRLTKLWNYERYGLPRKEGGRYFISKNDGLQNQSVLYTMKSLQGKPKVLLDPNTLSGDGTVALMGYDISHDGKYMAYATSSAGSDWREIKVRDIETSKDLPDEVKWVKFSEPTFTKDGKGFFYARYDEPDKNELTETNYSQKLYYHRLHTPQSADELVYWNPEHKKWGYEAEVSDDGKYLIISIREGTERKDRIYYKDISKPDSKIVKLLDEFDALYAFIGNQDDTFYMFTSLDAPRARVVAIDLKNPAKSNWREIIPQNKDTLSGASMLNNQLVCNYMSDAHTEIRIHDLSGKHLRDVELPGLGSAGGFHGKQEDSETFYAYTAFTQPTTIYRYDMKTGLSTVFRKPKVDIDPERFETRQVFYRSKDGTRVPMFISYKKGLRRNGKNPTYLYGYGGFNISLTPWFSVSSMVWMEMGGILAVPNLRGGGEYGKEWHEGGKVLTKQNTFDDFIAAAEWLIANDYTASPKLAIGGGSNGGLLVGACMTQRPDLFGAALPAVGVLDMLRFHKFTIGWAWVSDYGSSEDPQQFAYLYKYSPLHNLKPGTSYPATMITTADHDDRVVPAHSFKFAATLQADQSGPAPTLIRIETKAGHGAGKPTSKRIEEAADQWAFLVKTLGGFEE